MTGAVDLFIVFHNSRRWIPDLMAALSEISIPVTGYFLDNASTDGTPELLATGIQSLPFPAYVLRSTRNNGFARGMNLLAAQSRGEFMFLLNPDTRLENGCLESLISKAKADPRAAICEARQSPREHPKAWDRSSGETSWCSGAAALVRRGAFEQVGGFDDRLFFMYCEDIDLSWRLWLSDWKCIYVPSAVVQHFTQDLQPGKARTAENYYDFRNSLFLYYRFGRKNERGVLWSFLRKRLLSGAYPLRSKVLFAIALVDHIRYIPLVLRSRKKWGHGHTWIRLSETSLFR